MKKIKYIILFPFAIILLPFFLIYWWIAKDYSKWVEENCDIDWEDKIID